MISTPYVSNDDFPIAALTEVVELTQQICRSQFAGFATLEKGVPALHARVGIEDVLWFKILDFAHSSLVSPEPSQVGKVSIATSSTTDSKENLMLMSHQVTGTQGRMLGVLLVGDASTRTFETQLLRPLSLLCRQAAAQIELRQINRRNILKTSDRFLDIEAVRRHFHGDEDLLKEVAEIYLKQSQELTQKLKNAIATNDATQVHHCAHLLKGMIANFFFRELTEALQRLEHMGKIGDLNYANEMLYETCDGLERLERDLKTIFNRGAK